ncbi:hypothetical protein [Nocardia sp. NPDC049707]|uniref:hypothetical protein n=1 Tax=Nocardia sp. NPDC049707 TaxID=3154735 RepID=UPI0034435C8D
MTQGWEPTQHWQPPPPAVSVVVEASNPTWTKVGWSPMMVEFAPGLRFELHPGQNHFSLLPGRYRVRLWSGYGFGFGDTGKATLDIDATGGPVWIYYAAPYFDLGRGAAGFEPQRRRIGVIHVAILCFVVLCMLLTLL